ATAIAWISFLARANSSGVIAAKSFVRRSSFSLQAPSAVSPPSTSGPGPGGEPLRRSPCGAGGFAASCACTAAPRNQAWNARSNGSMSSRRDTSVCRSVQYTSSWRASSTASSPFSASATRPGPTSSPASRSTRPNVTMWETTALAGTGAGDEPGERLVADREQILVVLEHRAERRLDVLDVELLPAERRERLRPVDRLGETRRLLQVERPQLGHERRGLGGEPLRHAGYPQLHDLDLPLECGVADPVEEAAALERVVQLAGAIRREDDVRTLLRFDRAELGHGDL